MFVSVIHGFGDPETFSATAASAASGIPAEIKLHQIEYIPIEPASSMGPPYR